MYLSASTFALSTEPGTI